ncbi:MAG: hypothetical protein ACRCS0_01035 [Albidovulum sp.]
MTPDPDIAALLEPGERIRWQGAPVAGLHRPFQIAGMAVFGTPFLVGGIAAAGFAIWTLMRATEWQMIALAVFILLFSLPFLGIGLLLVLGVSLDRLFAAPRRMRYVLTDSRALILSDFPTRKVASYPILKSSPLVHEPSARAGSVYFHVQSTRDSDNQLEIKREGFENIADSAHVFQLMRQVQLGAAATPG